MSSDPVRALSVKQPWAALIVVGLKAIENRSWATQHRGPLVIHAARHDDPEAPSWAWEELRRWLRERGVDEGEELPRAALCGVVEVTDCVPLAKLPRPLRASPYAIGPVCWLLERPRIIQATPWRGVPGLFGVPAEVVREAIMR